jgi:hypothetical protein
MGFFDRFRKLPSQQQFAVQLIAALRSMGDTRPWEYSEGTSSLILCVKAHDTSSGVINLPNIYREFLAANGKERDAALKRQAMAMMQQYIPADFAEARPRLRPVIRSETERGMAYLQTGVGSGKRDIAFRSLCENIEIGIAYDGEFNIMRLTESKLAEWNVTFGEAYDVAMDNLRLQSAKPFMALKDGVFASQFGDYYDASRVLLTDLLYRQPISGAPVVMVPNRTALLLTGDNNEAGLQAMLQVAEEAYAQPRPLPPVMLRWDGQGWQRFAPAGLESRLRKLRVQELSGDYSDQLTHLNANHQRDGVDIFVAKYTVVQRDTTGELLTVCAWTEGVHSLLPVTDTVALYRPTVKQFAYVPWAELVQMCGQLMTPIDCLPVRYEVQGFPEEDLFQSLHSRFDKL